MNTIEIFPWNKNFNTDLAKVDEQHQRLVQLLNLLAQHAASLSDIQGFNVVFDELSDYAVYHFQTEETIWHEYLPDDPLELEHQKDHKNFAATIQGLKAELNTKSVDSVVLETLSYLTHWLASHILENDRYMAMVVLAIKSGLPKEQAEDLAKAKLNESMNALIEIVLTSYYGLCANALQLISKISELKRADAKIQRISNLYAALSECDQVIVRCTNVEELFPQICRIAVQFGSMKMAWIGLTNTDTCKVLPVASFGVGIEYLQDFELSIDDDSLFKNDIVGISLREDRALWCQDFMHDPATAPLRERGAHYGWTAKASLPLHRNGVVIGAFVLYASNVNAFDEAARDLLTKMAADISFALDNLARATAREQMESDLRESEARFRTLAEDAPEAIVIHDLESGLFVDATTSAERLFGCSRDEILRHGPKYFYAPNQPDDAPSFDSIRERGERILAGDQMKFERLVRNCKGQDILCEVRLVRLPSTKKKLIRASYIDITERKQAELELRIAATAFEAQEAIVVTDAKTVIMRVNQAFSRVSGYSAEEAIGQTPSMLRSGHHDGLFFHEMWKALNLNHYWQGEIWNRRKNGEVHPDWLTITAVTTPEGQVTNYVSSFSDISQHKMDEEAIHSLAFYDPLTNLPNRRLLYDRLQHSLAASARHHNHGAVLFIDLDNFKALNDTRGHSIGDLFLVEVANRILTCVREGDTAARLGGDEFVIMLEELSENVQEAANQAEVVGEKILAAIKEPSLLQGYEYSSTASIGISLFHDQDISVDDLLIHIDTAMYKAKSMGRNTLRFYEPAMQAALEARIVLESGLRLALERDEFRLLYQPQVDIRSGKIMGVEALIRWQHPERGLVSPLEFIPMAEECGLIISIGEWVLKTACTQAKKWADMGFDSLRVAVNLSARQFRHKNLIDALMRVISDTKLPVHMLELEITESLIMHGIADAIDMMREIKVMGIRFSIDDFGTGYSSLSYLSRFPISTLKIDQSFMRDVTSTPESAAIVKAIITMAHSLRLNVIAEGVETEGQLAFLERYRCNEIQGYLFSKPIPAEDCTSLLREDRRLALSHIRNESQQHTLLLVDDEDNIRSSLVRLLRGSGYRILTAESAEKGLELLALNDIGVILSDQRMPGMTGVEFLRLVKELYPQTIRMVLSGYTELKTVTAAINEGAIYKFLTKPWDDDQLRANIEEAFSLFDMKHENALLQDEVSRVNAELSQKNAELERRVQEKGEEIAQNINFLQISQEILENLTNAVIGVDDLGMITIANRKADELFGAAHLGTLLGSQAAERLPAAMNDCLKEGKHNVTIVLPDGRSGAVWCHRMGNRSISKGMVIEVVVENGESHAT